MARAKGSTVDKRDHTGGLQYHSELSDMTGLILQSYLIEPKDLTEHMQGQGQARVFTELRKLAIR